MKRKKTARIERLLGRFKGWDGVTGKADRDALEKYLISKVSDCGEAWSWASMTRQELQASVRLVDPGIYVEPDGEPVTIEEEIERRLAQEKIARLVMRGDGPPPTLPLE